MALNPMLLELARQATYGDSQRLQKSAVVAPPAAGGMPMDPAAAAGGMPMDPAAAAGGMPMDPAMAGGMPPTDPAAAAAGVTMPPAAAMPPAAPAPPSAMDASGAPQKVKPEDRMNQLDFRLYNIQQQLTAIMNRFEIDLPPGALITPPGSPVPVAEAAIPGGQQDPAVAAGGNAATDNGTGISPIAPLGAFDPAAAGGATKAAALSGVGRGVSRDIVDSPTTQQMSSNLAGPQHQKAAAAVKPSVAEGVAAAAALLRSRLYRNG